MASEPPVHPHSPGLSSVIERNIQALLERRRKQERQRTTRERIADGISAFAGSITFVYLHVLFFGTWLLLSTGWLPLPRFDPTLVKLATFASVEAIFLSTFVLMTQNRMSVASTRRAELDLQISLLAEHEVTRLIKIVSALAEHAGVEQPPAEELSDLKQDIAPEKVLDRLEGH
jgi:uncharacterized membrane protein